MTSRDFENGRWEWKKAEDTSLARFALDNARQWLANPRLLLNPFDKNGTPEGRIELIEALYSLLLSYEIGYGPEPYEREKATQWIRTPPMIVQNREGTCLDLALLFCGLCLDCHLIPWLVKLEGHAFAMVSLEYSLHQESHRQRAEVKLFAGLKPMSDPKAILALLDEKRYLAIECTGFALAPSSLPENLPEGRGRLPNGSLDFATARRVGEEHLRTGLRRLDYAIDLAVARFEWKIEADHLPAPAQAAPAAAVVAEAPASLPSRLGVLPYLCDRVPQRQVVTEQISNVIEQEFSRPLAFLIDGDEDQDHGALIQRLVAYDLPGTFELPEDVPGVTQYKIDLPRPDPNHFDLALRRDLAKRLGPRGRPSPTWGELTEQIKGRSGPILFKTTYSTSAWEVDRAAGFDRLDALLRSWEGCGDLPARRAILVCVLVVFEESFADPSGRPGPNEALREHLARLGPELEAGARHPDIIARRLDPLTDVSKVDVNDWQAEPLVQEFCEDHDFSGEIDGLFRDPAAGPRQRLPMAAVVPQLQQWLKPFAGRS